MARLEPIIMQIVQNEELELQELIEKIYNKFDCKINKDKIIKRIKKLIGQEKIIKNKKNIIKKSHENHNKKNIDFRRRYHKLRKKSKIAFCMHPNKEECSEKIIKSHSIQNNRILKKIADDGEVIGIDALDLLTNGNLANIGRIRASTFFGFCNKHDTETFSPIENKDYIAGDREQDFLFAYRAFCKERSSKINSYSLLENARNELPANSINETNYLNAALIGHQFATQDMEHYGKIFDKILLKKHYDNIITKSIILNREYLIAVSTGLTLIQDFQGNIINDLSDQNSLPKYLYLTIFPQKGNTYILISYHKEHANIFNFLEQQLISIPKREQLKRLNILISKTESFYLNPSKWRSIPEVEKNELKSDFFANMESLENNSALKEPKFNLFI